MLVSSPSIWGAPPDSDLTVSVLTKKCAMLLALSASKRQSDLRAIDLRFKKCIPEGVSFQLAALTKTRTTTKSMDSFSLLSHTVKGCAL